jgi:hypothetical protein
VPACGAEPTAASGPLDLHEGIGPEGSKSCPRWPANLRLENTLGELVPGRCKATNLCAYCARLAAVENAEVLAQDAMTNTPPLLWSVLTTRTATIDTGAFKHAREMVLRRVRESWPEAQCATLIEFSTGLGTHSGGDRRPHWNDTWKGIPADSADELHHVIARAWCDRVDAKAKAQHVQPIAEVGGLMRYLALHFQKESQAPPQGWRGHRFRTSRGYLAESMPEARERAREALRYGREVRRLERVAEEEGVRFGAQELHEWATLAVERKADLGWQLVRLEQLPTAFGPDGLPASWEDVVTPVGDRG